MAITKEQIFAIAEGLDADGHSPTLAAVRKALGGGSFTTISEGVNEWRSRKLAKEAPIREPAPQAIGDRLNEFGAEVWAIASELANNRLAAERDALNTARVQLEAEKCEAAEMANQVSAEFETLQAKLSLLERSEMEAKQEVERLRLELTRATERAAAAEIRAEENSKRADDLNAELARVNHMNAELLKTISAAARDGNKETQKPRPGSTQIKTKS